jgi:arsenite-transporting ATPase
VQDLLAVRRTPDGFELSLALPLARREDLDLARSGDELVVTVAGHRRLLPLPSALQRCEVVGARLAADRLLVTFTPDPTQWRTP